MQMLSWQLDITTWLGIVSTLLAFKAMGMCMLSLRPCVQVGSGPRTEPQGVSRRAEGWKVGRAREGPQTLGPGDGDGRWNGVGL